MSRLIASSSSLDGIKQQIRDYWYISNVNFNPLIETDNKQKYLVRSELSEAPIDNLQVVKKKNRYRFEIK